MEKGEIIFTTEKGAIQIYDTWYDGEHCYCIEHIPTGHKEIVDYNADVINAIIRKVKRTKSLTVDKKRNGYMLKFNKRGREGNISLRNYVFSKYYNMPLDILKRAKIVLFDNNAYEHNILDLRSSNLYDAGGYRCEGIEIIRRPNIHDEKYIVVTTKDENVSIQEYSKDLFDILTTGNMCGRIQTNKRNGRHCITIHYANKKEGYAICNLARFVLMYYKYFGKYKRQKGSKIRFVHAFPTLSVLFGENNDCGHINSRQWNNSRNNVAIMDKKVNQEMRDYATQFIREYSIFPITIHEENDIVLVEMEAFGKRHYYRCNNMEEYADLQRVMIGKSKLTENLRISKICKDEQKAYEIDTPSQAYKKKGAKDKIITKEDILEEFWKWCNKRDELLDIYKNHPEIFKDWSCCAKGTDVNTLFNNLLPAMLASFMD